MTELREARIVAEVRLARHGGTRAVGIDADGVCHVFTVHGGETAAAPEQSFTPEIAREMARRVLSGDERAQTTHGVMRILAAAVLMDGMM